MTDPVREGRRDGRSGKDDPPAERPFDANRAAGLSTSPFRGGMGRWGVGWGLQNSGGGPQGYGWGGGWQGGFAPRFGRSGFAGGLSGTPEFERGRFAGRGPSGYARSDERISEDVNEALTAHPEIDATEIVVSVVAGEVTLEGTVDDRRAKRLAEDVAAGCRGVKDVHNRLRVGPASAPSLL